MKLARPRRLELVVWPLVGIFACGVALVAALVIADYRKAAQGAARGESERIAHSAEASINRSLIGVDLLLAGLDRIPGVLRPARDAVDARGATEMLRAISEQNLMVTALMVLDEKCQVLATSDEAATRVGTGLPAGFCEQAYRQMTPQLTISVPASSFATGERVLYLARAAPLSDGTRVLAVATVPLSQLATVLSQSIEADGLVVTLERDDGLLLASVPMHSPLIGATLRPALDAAAASGRATLAPGRLGDGPAFVSARPTVYRSIFVAAGIAESTAMAQTESQRILIMVAAGAFVLLAIVAGGLVHAYLRAADHAAHALNAAKTVLDQALDAMADGFLLCDADDRVVTWNAHFLETYPHLRDVVAVGVPFRALVEVGARTTMAEAAESERARWVEARMVAHRTGGRGYEQTLPGGRTIHWLERRTSTGGIVSVLRDVTPERAAAAELERAKGAAEAANEAKSRFLATMSHEIRTPLAGVLGMNDLLLETLLTDEQRRYAETVRDSGQALLNVINDILDFSRLEAGRVALVFAPFQPAGLVEEVALLLGVSARAKGIVLDTDVAADLPEWLEADQSRLRQVLYNLVGNAIKFTNQGRVTIQARHRTRPDDGVDLEVVVRDTGIGIAPEALSRLFERFSQADNGTARRFGGSGLGLAISRELVELMGGTLEVDSRLGAGSAFRVTLPMRNSAPPAQNDCALEPQDNARATQLNVLVAEDNRVNQLLIRTLLDRMGHRADLVGDGRAALAQVQATHYDVVLMDIQMPEMDGETAARAIRALPGPVSRIPIIALTAHAMAEHRLRYLAAGMDDYVAKPIDRDLLATALARVTRARRPVAT